MSVNYEVRDAVAVITLNRPDKLNALTPEMREALGTFFEKAGRDSEVRAVLLTSAGKAFCASGDVSRMGDFTPQSGRDLLKLAHRMVRNLANIEKPVVASVRGEVPSLVNPPSGCAFHSRCPQAVARCQAEMPLLRTLEGGQQVACHLA